jgi:hypothetical protein
LDNAIAGPTDPMRDQGEVSHACANEAAAD